MAAVEPEGRALADAGERLPTRTRRFGQMFVVAVVVAVQAGWVGALAYAAYRFL